ncbi:MAG: hypothetical protein JWP63_2508 [Candidatus Solibacter sp.]|nr:hypothetical protein [Candidatus Solibacter sp.]
MEYSLLIAFLAMAAIGVLSQVGVGVQGPWNTAGTTLAAANGNPSTTATTPGGGGRDHGDGDHGDGDGH